MVKINSVQPVNTQVPYYKQHYDLTCGPASLMMAMKYFDKHLPLTKCLEIDIWREGNMVEVYGTSRFGLAYSAAIRGFHVRVTSRTGRIDFVDRLIPPLKDLNTYMLKLHFYERRERCRKLVEERKEPISSRTIYNTLLSNYVPLIITSILFCKGENLPHWIVVNAMDNNFLYFNNPLYVNPQKKKFKLSTFEKVIGYRGDQYMVEIWK